jgi:UDP-glucuronate decarboxylase
LAEHVVALSGSNSKIVAERPKPKDDPMQRRPDITLARTRLGWSPTIPLREGLKRTIDWFKSIDMSTYRPPTPNY